MTICGIGNKDSYKTKEETRKVYDVSDKKLPCGHVGCNFHEGCYTCKMKKAKQAEDDDIEKDKVLVKELLEKTSSNVLKSCLREFLNDQRAKKRKLDDESLEKYRNAVNNCTCDAKYFAY
jgi:hypothetical protein